MGVTFRFFLHKYLTLPRVCSWYLWSAGEHLLKNTAARLGIKLVGKMHECAAGFSMTKGFRKGIPHSTDNRASEKLGRVFVDPYGRKMIASLGKMFYPMIIKDGYTRRMRIYFLKHKSDAGTAGGEKL